MPVDSKYSQSQFLWGGDFNLVRNPNLDRSRGPERRPCAAARALEGVILCLDLSDVWHFRHPNIGGYMHYSAYHNLHKRIDYWLVSPTLLDKVRDCRVLPRTMSNHSPLLLSIATPKKGIPPFTWRFPPYSLLDPVFKSEMAEAIETFFTTNVGSVDSFQMFWEAFKVYIHGVAMSKHTGVLHEICRRLAQTMKKLGSLEQQQQTNPDDTVVSQIKTLLQQYHEDADAEVKHMGKYATAMAYGESERQGSVLAQLLKRHCAKIQVEVIRSPQGEPLMDEIDIASRFKSYYTELYTTRSTRTSEEISDYLSYIKLPFLTNTHREFLMLPM